MTRAATKSASTTPTTPREVPGSASEDQDGTYGLRGWSVRAGVWEVLARCPAQEMYCPSPEQEPPAALLLTEGPDQDYNPFHGLGPQEAGSLLGLLPEPALGDRQNLAPSLGALLRACAGAGGRVLLSGYGIGPQRQDERVSVEALWVADPDLLGLEVTPEHEEGCQCQELWRTVARRYELDAQALPDELRLLPRYGTHGEPGWWLWWD